MFLLVLFVAVGCTGEAGYKPVDFSERATHYPPVRDQEKRVHFKKVGTP